MRKLLTGSALAIASVGMPGMLVAMPSITPESVAKADRTTVATSTLKTAAAAVKPQPPRTTLRATIDLTRQRMTVVANGKRLYHWPISSGRRGFETPRGSFRPGWMAKNWHSRKYNMAPMPYSVFFNQGIATHGTTAVSRLGRPASHGCIRLAHVERANVLQSCPPAWHEAYAHCCDRPRKAEVAQGCAPFRPGCS